MNDHFLHILTMDIKGRRKYPCLQIWRCIWIAEILKSSISITIIKMICGFYDKGNAMVIILIVCSWMIMAKKN
jgi:hypothetical protein